MQSRRMGSHGPRYTQSRTRRPMSCSEPETVVKAAGLTWRRKQSTL